MSEQKIHEDVPVTVRMPAPMVGKIRALATANERTFSQELRLAARKHLEAQGASASS